MTITISIDFFDGASRVYKCDFITGIDPDSDMYVHYIADQIAEKWVSLNRNPKWYDTDSRLLAQLQAWIGQRHAESQWECTIGVNPAY